MPVVLWRGGTSWVGKEAPLQAVLLADSLEQKFHPITFERPKVLLPLVSVPMIDYTLDWLESAGVQEVIVYCYAHFDQIISHLMQSVWNSKPNFSVTALVSDAFFSAGDALRSIHELNLIHGDFILISGDIVSNMSLTKALKEHKDRRKKDSYAVMTMVIRQSDPSAITHQTSLGTNDLYMAIDRDSNQLLYYKDRADHLKGTVCLEKLLPDYLSLSLSNAKQDCYIDICSPEVLSLFANNVDYQHLRCHFVNGLLLNDIMGYKIFTHEIRSCYAAKVDNFRSYDAISKYIIRRWRCPLVPDDIIIQKNACKLNRQEMYRASEMRKSRTAEFGPYSVIEKSTIIGNNTKVLQSVIGGGCVIGSDVLIERCYIWNNVTIEDGCELRNALICDGVILKSGVVLNPGVVLSFNVVIGQQCVVPAYLKVFLLQQPIKQDSNEKYEYAEQYIGTFNSSFMPSSDELSRDFVSLLTSSPSHAASEVGAGYIRPVCYGSLEDDWRHSVAPIPVVKLIELALDTDFEYGNSDCEYDGADEDCEA